MLNYGLQPICLCEPSEWHDYEPIVGDTHEISYMTIVKRNPTEQEIKISYEGVWLWAAIILFLATRKMPLHQDWSSHHLWTLYAPPNEKKIEGGGGSCQPPFRKAIHRHCHFICILTTSLTLSHNPHIHQHVNSISLKHSNHYNG